MISSRWHQPLRKGVLIFWMGMLISACLSRPPGPELPEEPDPSPTPLMAEVLMRVQLDYLAAENLEVPPLLESALLALEREIPEVRVQFPNDGGRRYKVLLRESSLATLEEPRTLRQLLEELQPLLLELQEELPEYRLRELEHWTLTAVLEGLDPHSVVLPPASYAEFNENTRGRFAGVGIVVGIREEQLTVLSLMPGGPAERAGLQTGDRVLQIDGESTKKMSLSAIMQGLRGEVGTAMELSVERNQRVLRFELQREDIQVSSCDWLDLGLSNRRVARYVRLKLFQEDTSLELERALRNLDQTHGLILDLRNNPGGLLQEAVRVSDLFLPPDQQIVSTQTNTDLTSYSSHQLLQSSQLQNIPLVILVNEQSASASEIVSAALQENKRALVLGERTFGKGTVQSVWGLPDDYGLKMTIARYLTPDNRSLQDVGVQPNLRLDPLFFSPKEVRLRSLQQPAPENHLVLHYLRAPDDAPYDPDTPLGEEALEHDDFVRIARQLLQEHQPQRESLEATLHRLHPQLQARSEREVIREVQQQAGLDWSLSSRALPDRPPVIEVHLEQVSEQGVWQESSLPLHPDQPLRVRIQATNVDTSPLERLLVITQSSEDWLDEIEFPFGKLEPGQSAEWVRQLPLEELERPSWLSLDLLTIAGADQVLERKALRWSVIPETPPDFRVGIQILDDGQDGSEGNGNGLPEPGETVALALSLQLYNLPQLEDVVLRLGSSEDRLIWLQDRVEWTEIQADQVYEERMLVRIPQMVQDLGRWQVALFTPHNDRALWNYIWSAADGPQPQVSAPQVQVPQLVSGEPLQTNLTAQRWELQLLDRDGLLDAYWFVNGRKRTYISLGNRRVVPMVWEAPLQPGSNQVELVLRDRFGLASRHQWYVWREMVETTAAASRPQP